MPGAGWTCVNGGWLPPGNGARAVNDRSAGDAQSLRILGR
jgi:hypothetical protein